MRAAVLVAFPCIRWRYEQVDYVYVNSNTLTHAGRVDATVLFPGTAIIRALSSLSSHQDHCSFCSHHVVCLHSARCLMAPVVLPYVRKDSCVVLVSGVGKTSICSRYVEDSFSHDPASTVLRLGTSK